MPQSQNIYEESLVDLNGWQLLSLPLESIGAGMGISHCCECVYIYSFECYAGSSIGGSWHPVNEAKFGRLMAFASAVRWEADLLIEI